eukprot:m.194240 g.194240  ORF g.194240 m.194240 type:complete len:114 (+) comp18645_c0_seq24:1421-1762(+)
MSPLMMRLISKALPKMRVESLMTGSTNKVIGAEDELVTPTDEADNEGMAEDEGEHGVPQVKAHDQRIPGDGHVNEGKTDAGHKTGTSTVSVTDGGIMILHTGHNVDGIYFVQY